jgi:hypothetical protein
MSCFATTVIFILIPIHTVYCGAVVLDGFLGWMGVVSAPPSNCFSHTYCRPSPPPPSTPPPPYYSLESSKFYFQSHFGQKKRCPPFPPAPPLPVHSPPRNALYVVCCTGYWRVCSNNLCICGNWNLTILLSKLYWATDWGQL